MVVSSKHLQSGFTLIEGMLVVAILAIVVAIAYPNYQRSVIKTKRVDMMTSLQSIASNIQAKKLAKGNYAAVDKDKTQLTGAYPQQGTPKLYTVDITLDANSDNLLGDWKLTATPIITTLMKDDGILTLDAIGIKCRGTECGQGDEWNKNK